MLAAAAATETKEVKRRLNLKKSIKKNIMLIIIYRFSFECLMITIKNNVIYLLSP